MFTRLGHVTWLLAILALLFTGPAALAQGPMALPAVSVVVFEQPSSAAGGLLQSSLRDPNGSDTDQWAWDAFLFIKYQTITEIRWRGGHDPARLGSGGPVLGFVVSIYASSVNNTQPDVNTAPLVRYELADNAGETASVVVNQVQLYDYAYVLPAPFAAFGKVKYWMQIEALQGGAPDWGLAAATGGDGTYFRRLAGDGFNYQTYPGDTAFALLGPATATVSHTVTLPLILKR